MADKINLKELKALIKHFKAHECPRLGQKKAVLLKFAEEHGLLKKAVPVVEEKVVVGEKKPRVIKVKKETLAEHKKVVVAKQVVKEFKTKDGKKVKIVQKVKVPKNEMVKVEEPKKNEVVIEVKKAEEPIKGRKEMSGAEMAQYDLAKQRRDKKALEHFHKAFPGLLTKNK